MHSFFPRSKMRYAAAVLVSAAATIAYVYYLFLPGVWYGDAFLYLDKNDGSFSGTDKYAHYVMKITPHTNETYIEFSVNGEKRVYRHKRLELMRPMLAQFPHSRLFGICKAASLASPCKNSCTKIFRCIGSASSKRANFLQEKAKAELIVYLLTSILTHYCGKFAFLNRMGFESLMPTQ